MTQQKNFVLSFIFDISGDDELYQFDQGGLESTKHVTRYGLGCLEMKQSAHFHNQRSNHVMFTFLPYMVVQYCLFLDFWLNAEKIFTKKEKRKPKIITQF